VVGVCQGEKVRKAVVACKREGWGGKQRRQRLIQKNPGETEAAVRKRKRGGEKLRGERK